jgi:hypothetical protein
VRRVAVVALVLAIALAAGLFFALRGGGEGNKPVAHVGGESIDKSQLDAVVRHFEREAENEGRPLPDGSSDAGRRLRNRLLGLIVYRVELRQAARRLGISVTRVQVLRRVESSRGGEEATTTPDSFDYGSAETQLLTEAIFRKVTRHVKAPTQARLSAKRNAAMTRFVARLQRETEVRYEPGYAPGS